MLMSRWKLLKLAMDGTPQERRMARFTLKLYKAMKDADEKWITVNGTHIFVGEGGEVKLGPSKLKNELNSQSSTENSGKGQASLSEAEKQELQSLRNKYKNLEQAMLFGSNEDMTRFAELTKKEQDLAGDYDYDVRFNNQKITESELYQQRSDPSSEVSSAIWAYSMNSYEAMNNHLREGTPVSEKTKEQIELLHGWLSQQNTTQELYLRRGLTISNQGLSSMLGINVHSLSDIDKAVGKKFTEKGFCSTTTDSWGGFGGNVLMYIKAPAGTHGAYIRDCTKQSSEREFLLDSGQTYIIRNVKHTKTRYGDDRVEMYCEVQV